MLLLQIEFESRRTGKNMWMWESKGVDFSLDYLHVIKIKLTSLIQPLNMNIFELGPGISTRNWTEQNSPHVTFEVGGKIIK